MYLKRYHDIVISPSGIWRILRRLELSRPPSSQRYKPHNSAGSATKKPLPGHAVQVDVKFTAIDDCTHLRVLKIYDRLNQKSAIDFVDYALGSVFHWHVLDKGVAHVYNKPATPRLNGKVERSHRIDADEFCRMLERMVVDDTKLFNSKLEEWAPLTQLK